MDYLFTSKKDRTFCLFFFWYFLNIFIAKTRAWSTSPSGMERFLEFSGFKCGVLPPNFGRVAQVPTIYVRLWDVIVMAVVWSIYMNGSKIGYRLQRQYFVLLTLSSNFGHHSSNLFLFYCTFSFLMKYIQNAFWLSFLLNGKKIEKACINHLYDLSNHRRLYALMEI